MSGIRLASATSLTRACLIISARGTPILRPQHVAVRSPLQSRQEMVGDRYGHLLHQASTGDANGPLGLDELRQVVQIQVVGAEIGIAIKSDDCVEKLGRKGQ